ncbi:MAG: hypothetical protein KTR20_14110 [Cellvibrionaceae bacterium]|nr:hypothetical protein [Cellvibrionaceae bacterium]
MNDLLMMTDLILTNAVLGWLGVRLVKRIDQLDNRMDQHETRLTVAERDIEYAQKKH